MASDAKNDADHRPQILVARSMEEAGVAHDANETGVGVLVPEAGNVAVDLYEGKSVTRVSNVRRDNVQTLRFSDDDSINHVPDHVPHDTRGSKDTPKTRA